VVVVGPKEPAEPVGVEPPEQLPHHGPRGVTLVGGDQFVESCRTIRSGEGVSFRWSGGRRIRRQAYES